MVVQISKIPIGWTVAVRQWGLSFTYERNKPGFMEDHDGDFRPLEIRLDFHTGYVDNGWDYCCTGDTWKVLNDFAFYTKKDGQPCKYEDGRPQVVNASNAYFDRRWLKYASDGGWRGALTRGKQKLTQFLLEVKRCVDAYPALDKLPEPPVDTRKVRIIATRCPQLGIANLGRRQWRYINLKNHRPVGKVASSKQEALEYLPNVASLELGIRL